MRVVASDAGVEIRSAGKAQGVSTGEEIVLSIVTVATIFLVLGSFVWAAIKDGQEDKALQKRLRIRRRTRLGR